ncbi:MAG: orotate phosphoribosyltransferase [Rhodothermales bacterium]|nr:orotate phosphoribosyltransferase [Rhodothermales bacterium]
MTTHPPPDFNPRERRIAGALLSIGAVALSPEAPFTWASGLKSPIYCDNRLTMAHPDIRRQITRGFGELIDQYELSPDVIAGTATAGIPHAAWLAEVLDLPMVYVRSKPKEHGRLHQIEGQLEPGRRVVVIEDLISTGGSSMAVVRVLQQAGAVVEAVLGIFSYGFPEAHHLFKEAGVPAYTLTTFAALMDVAAAEGRIPENAREALDSWRKDPKAWSEAVVAREQIPR